MPARRRPSPPIVVLMLAVLCTQSGGATVLAAPAGTQLPAASAGSFPQDALPANRNGRLSDAQLRQWHEVARERRKNNRSFAYVAGAIGAVLLIADGSPSKAVARRIVGAASLALVPVILMIANHDALSADLRDGRVESIDGAIAKRVVQGRAWSSYYFDIDRRRLEVSRSGYDAAPDAGIVRVYFLPRSRRVVNLERLPDPPLPAGPDAARQIVANVIAALHSHDPVALAEARARAAAFADAIKGPAIGSGATTHLQAAELYGSWTNPLMTVTFARDGAATLVTAAAQRTGHWTVDAQGRLLTDATGTLQPLAAWLDGDRLWISVEGRAVLFTRVPDRDE
ncbi:MAG TPA: hypothetical protein VGL62_05505 [Vicinamibacterales bacterium]